MPPGPSHHQLEAFHDANESSIQASKLKGSRRLCQMTDHLLSHRVCITIYRKKRKADAQTRFANPSQQAGAWHQKRRLTAGIMEHLASGESNAC